MREADLLMRPPRPRPRRRCAPCGCFCHRDEGRYTVHSGQKYGAHFVLYEGSPDEVHSRYCVHVMNANGGDSWGHMKTMSRLMPVSLEDRAPQFVFKR